MRRGAHADDGGNVKYSSFDQIYQVCYAVISNLWRDVVEEDESTSSTTSASLNEDLVGFQHDNDLVIVANGIWELARKNDCDRQSPAGTTTEERLQRTLANLEKNNPDDLQVVYRTSGWWDKRIYEYDSRIRNENALTRQFFNELKQQPELGRYRKNLTLVDWGHVMERSLSYTDERMALRAHYYGIEARPLFIQQLTNELVKSELIARYAERRKDEGTTVLVQSSPSVRRE